jgi:hypothetical protein
MCIRITTLIGDKDYHVKIIGVHPIVCCQVFVKLTI